MKILKKQNNLNYCNVLVQNIHTSDSDETSSSSSSDDDDNNNNEKENKNSETP